MSLRHLAVLILCCTTTASLAAAPTDATRAAQFTRLPNWTGLWTSSAWKLGVSGRPVGGEQELRANLQLLKAPPYNPEWNNRYEAGLKDTAMMAQRNATLKVCSRSFPALTCCRISPSGMMAIGTWPPIRSWTAKAPPL